MASPFYTTEHEAYRDVVRRFVARRSSLTPMNGMRRAGFRGSSMRRPPQSGCWAWAFRRSMAAPKSIISCDRGRAGTGAGRRRRRQRQPEEQFDRRAADCPRRQPEFKARVLPQILSGKKISALAITEPSGGSDVANLRTSARRNGDCYVVNGEKTFITSGMRADYITTAVRPGGPGPGGVSLLVIEGDTPGLSRTPLKKMGFRHRDAAFRRLPVTPAGSMDSGPAPRGASRNDEDNDKMLFTSDHEEARRILQKFIAVKINPSSMNGRRRRGFRCRIDQDPWHLRWR